MKWNRIVQLSLIKKLLKSGQYLLPALMKHEVHLVSTVDRKVLSGPESVCT